MNYPEIVVAGFTQRQEVQTPAARFSYLGGAAYATACAARAAGVQVGLVTRIGKDIVEDALPGFPPEGIRRNNTGKSARLILRYADLEFRLHPTATLQPGIAADLNPMDIPLRWVHHAKIVHIATMPPAMQSAFIEHLREFRPDVFISVDTGLSFLRHPAGLHAFLELAKRASLVFLNRYEYVELASFEGHLPTLVVKKDREGAELRRNGAVQFKVSAPVVTVTEVTNAGDVLAGNYLSGILRGIPEQEALSGACRAASLFTTRSGSARFDLL